MKTATRDLADRLREQAAARRDHDAIRVGSSTVTYGELDRRAAVAATALERMGVRHRSRVAAVVDDPIVFVELMSASFRLGAVFVPLLPSLAPDEVRHALVDSSARVVVVGPSRSAALRGLRGELPPITRVISTEPAPDEDSWHDACAHVTVGEASPDAVHDPDDLAALIYTSGTTGRPRAAMLSRGNLAVNQDQVIAGRLQIGPDDVVMITVPLPHIYSFTVGLGAALSVGATIVSADHLSHDDQLRLIVEERVTAVVGSPPLFNAWVASDALERMDTSTLRHVVSGAAPLSVQTIERFQGATGLVIEEGYGLAEASPSVAATPMAATSVAGSVGLPLPGVEVRLVGDDGSDVVIGDVGELWVRGPNVFKGYWNDEAATRAALTPDGWLRTGDLATRDDDGLLYLVDRLSDLVIVNGFSVFPGEIERVLLEDPSVAQAGAVGTPHPITGESIVAYVVAVDGVNVDIAALEQRCRERLARYKCPARIEVVETLPYTASGKVRRTVLRGG